MLQSLSIKPSHIENLKALKFNTPKARRLKAQGFGYIWTVYYDKFYENEVKRALNQLKAHGIVMLDDEDKKYYKLNNNADLTDDLIYRISRDIADRNVDTLSKIAANRDFAQNLNILISNLSGNEAIQNYVEFIVGFKIESRDQCDALRQFYNSLTQTFDSNVGF